MPVCNKCKKSSNCLTIDPCDHCGAKDWDEATVSSKTYDQSLSQIAIRFGCVLAIFVLLAIGFRIWAVLSRSDSDKLSSEYNVPVERVSAPPKPHGCAFSDAPLGDKHCHFEKYVYVYDRNGQIIESDGDAQTCPTGCGSAYSVGQVFVKVED
jgi:hypothetical protein